jgi:hypothetical protein
MPIVAIGVAGFALASGGAAAIGAVIAGTATLATALTAVAAVGSVVAAAGAVTGDKTLSTVGMVLGGVGGVGALAANAGLLGASATTESLFGSSVLASPASMGGDVASSLDGTMTGTMSGEAANSAATGFINETTGAIGGNVSENTGLDVSQAAVAKDPGAIFNSDGTDNLTGVVGGNVKMAADPGVVAGTSPGSPAQDALAKNPLPSGSATDNVSIEDGMDTGNGPTSAAPSSPSAPKVGGPVTGAPTAVSVADKNWFDANYPHPAEGMTVKNLATGNTLTYSAATGLQPVAADAGGIFGAGSFLRSVGGGELGMGVLQAGGAFLQGAFDPLKPAQAAAYDAQAKANLAAANLANQQNRNMGQALPVASRIPATGGGIINQRPGA